MPGDRNLSERSAPIRTQPLPSDGTREDRRVMETQSATKPLFSAEWLSSWVRGTWQSQNPKARNQERVTSERAALLGKSFLRSRRSLSLHTLECEVLRHPEMSKLATPSRRDPGSPRIGVGAEGRPPLGCSTSSQLRRREPSQNHNSHVPGFALSEVLSLGCSHTFSHRGLRV